MAETLIYIHDVFGDHDVPPGHVEHKGRFQAVRTALEADGLNDLARRAPGLASMEAVGRVHPEAHRRLIEMASPASGLAQLDADTFMGPSSLEAALRAAGGAIEAVDAIFNGEATNAFVAARPPGHHAEPDKVMGFCLFNSAAIAARHARAEHGAQRIAVVDFDVHHGNGTQAAFCDDEDAFFASSHEWPQYPGTGREDERGGFDNIRNMPLPTGTGGEGFRRAWGEVLLPALSDFDPDIIVVSAGFDAHEADPLGGLLLKEDDYQWLSEKISEIAADKCEKRMVSLLEGGYDLDALGRSAAAHVRALSAA